MRGLAALFVIITCVLQIVMINCFAGDQLMMAACFHMASAFLLLGAGFCSQKAETRPQGKPVLYFAFLLCLAFPVAGPVGAVVLWAVTTEWGRRMRAGIFEDYEKYIQEQSGPGFEAYLHVDALRRFRTEMNFQSFVDILQGQDISAKARVIEKLSRKFSRENIILLKEALRDESGEVRLLAANALIRLEEDMNQKLQKARETADWQERPEDYADLGDLYLRYAESGMLEEKMTHYYLELCAAAYQQSLDIETNQPDLIRRYGKCLLDLERYADAAKLLGNAVTIWPGNQHLLLLQAEALFRMRDFSNLSLLLQSRNETDFDEGHKQLMRFWCSPSASKN